MLNAGGLGLLAATPLASLAQARAKSTNTAPLDSLRLLVPASQGGGWDQTARAMGNALQASRLVDKVEYEYKPGKGGVPGLAYFVEKYARQPNTLMLGGMVMLGAIALNRAPIDLSQVTPVARLTSDALVILVPKASPLRNQAELNARIRSDAATLRFGGGSAGGVDHMLMGMMGRALQVDASKLRYQPFSGGGELVAALQKGDLDIGISGYSEAMEAINSGSVRALAISSRADTAGLRSLRNQGVATDLSNWRAVFAPPGLTPAQAERMTQLATALNGSSAWAAELQKNRWNNAFMTGKLFSEFLETEQTTARVVLHLLKLS